MILLLVLVVANVVLLAKAARSRSSEALTACLAVYAISTLALSAALTSR